MLSRGAFDAPDKSLYKGIPLTLHQPCYSGNCDVMQEIIDKAVDLAVQQCKEKDDPSLLFTLRLVCQYFRWHRRILNALWSHRRRQLIEDFHCVTSFPDLVSYYVDGTDKHHLVRIVLLVLPYRDMEVMHQCMLSESLTLEQLEKGLALYCASAGDSPDPWHPTHRTMQLTWQTAKHRGFLWSKSLEWIARRFLFMWMYEPCKGRICCREGCCITKQ